MDVCTDDKKKRARKHPTTSLPFSPSSVGTGISNGGLELLLQHRDLRQKFSNELRQKTLVPALSVSHNVRERFEKPLLQEEEGNDNTNSNESYASEKSDVDYRYCYGKLCVY